jgi:type I restriction enzyme M protein
MESDEPNLVVYGQEKTLETVKLAKMNIAVNGLRGEIKQANTYYEDLYNSFERFDYVLANPPFNVDDVNLSKVEKDRRFNTYGVPRNKSKSSKKDEGTQTVPNGNYLWINLFATSLKPTGRAALVMANSASDARHSEAEIRKTLIEKNLIYAMLTLPSNMFYTVTLPATLWFFDRAKTDNRILFIDARNIFTQIDRAHREFSDEQVLDIAVISRLQRGDRKGFVRLVDRYFGEGMERLKENKEKIKEVSKTLSDFLKAFRTNEMPDFVARLEEIRTLQSQYRAYHGQIDPEAPDKTNAAQRALAGAFVLFFSAIHEMLKTVDKRVRQLEKEHGNSKESKAVKAELDLLHKEIKDAEYFFTHINWLQERFPEAKYEDVTGLCKWATLEEVKEQDYSLNPGRYVGVVIEEDGKTEEEFTAELLALNEELQNLNREARNLEDIINHNIGQLTGEG